MEQSEQLDSVFAALAHPARREILSRLARKNATVNELAEPFDMSLPAISKHLQVLEKAGLIAKERKAQFRACRLLPEPLEVVSKWTENYRRIWETRFDAMDDILKEMKDPPHE